MVAIAERARQIAAWKQINKTIPRDVRNAWQERVDAFHVDKSKPNPYLLGVKGMCGLTTVRASIDIPVRWTYRTGDPCRLEEG
jgi:hypothetical protein